MFASSIIYAPGDPYLTRLERLALLPVMLVSGWGRATYQPIWAEDVADCVMSALRAQDGAGGDDGPASSGAAVASASLGSRDGSSHSRYELAGPHTLSHTDIVRTVLRSLNRQRPLLHVPTPIVSRSLRLLERAWGPRAFATWDEAELMEVPMISARGVADAQALGVTPQPMAAVLGSG